MFSVVPTSTPIMKPSHPPSLIPYSQGRPSHLLVPMAKLSSFRTRTRGNHAHTPTNFKKLAPLSHHREATPRCFRVFAPHSLTHPNPTSAQSLPITFENVSPSQEEANKTTRGFKPDHAHSSKDSTQHEATRRTRPIRPLPSRWPRRVVNHLSPCLASSPQIANLNLRMRVEAKRAAKHPGWSRTASSVGVPNGAANWERVAFQPKQPASQPWEQVRPFFSIASLSWPSARLHHARG